LGETRRDGRRETRSAFLHTRVRGKTAKICEGKFLIVLTREKINPDITQRKKKTVKET